jgi:hypothetical protein
VNVLILNGSPRKNGTVNTLLDHVVDGLPQKARTEWIDVCRLNMEICTGCMGCRETGSCVLPEDDAHKVGAKIDRADALVVGTPVHWGNMSAPLKLLFDRNVPVFMGESPRGMPVPQQKGKRAVIVTACTAPWPFNFVFAESRGAVRAVKKVLRCGGYKIVGTLVKPGTKESPDVGPRLTQRARGLGARLAGT